MTAIAILASAIAIMLAFCRARLIRERDAAIMDARKGWATAAAANDMRLEYRDAFCEALAAKQRSPETEDDDEPTAIATGPRLFGDDRRDRPERCADED